MINAAYAAYKYFNDAERRVLWEERRPCPACGERTAEDAEYCRHCGEDLPRNADGTLACTECGSVLSEGDRYCRNCGSDVGA